MHWSQPGLAVALTIAMVVAVVVFHYEVTHRLSRWNPEIRRRREGRPYRRPTLLLTMFVLLFAHIAEIWLFGMAYWLLLTHEGYGAVSGYSSVGLLDFVYFSASTYTAVGWGDMVTTGHIRFLAGTEALVGFMMITWSASFIYLIMARDWGGRDN